MKETTLYLENQEINIEQKIYFKFKRIFDIVIGIIGLIFLLPLAMFIKINYLLDGDKESIIYKQERIGQNGKTFTIFKFRTMIPNAEKELVKILKKNKKLAKEYEINHKLENDPRITKVGKMIRKVSLDEFPQMFNVLLGHMSIIGNRPYLPREKVDMDEYYDEIVKTKPGITGYWQVSGRSSTTFEKRLELESYYSNNFSFLLDFKIFLKTFSTVLFKKGAK